MSRIRIVAGLCLVAALVSGAIAAHAWWHNRPPYPASALHASARLQLVSDAAAQAFVGTDITVPSAGPGGQLLAGRISWHKPPAADGFFSIYVIDKTSRRMPNYIEATNSHVSAGTNSWDNTVATKYTWLRGAGAIKRNGGWTSAASDLTTTVAAGLTSITFIATFPKPDPDDPNADLYATAPIELSDLTVGLAFIGDDDQIYWATRLYG
jgi:hypothetical protein